MSRRVGSKNLLFGSAGFVTAAFGVVPGITLADQQESAVALEEIVVTARRRDEALMDTPVSITAFSGEDLKNRIITRAHQIAESTPNLIYRNNNQSGSSGNASIIFIRGIGQDDFAPSVQPGVGIYVDDVYIAGSIGSLSEILEVESIQVLRGPQGTLFGRNTIGGAILINSKKPDENFDGHIEAVVGEDSLRQMKAVVNIPFSDTFFGKFSISHREKDGWVDTPNISGDDGAGSEDIQVGRAAFRWLATEDLTIDLYGNFIHRESDGIPQIAGAINDNSAQLGTWNNNIAPTFGFGQINEALYRGSIGNPTNFADFHQRADSDAFSTALTFSWDISEKLNFKSISSYREVDSMDGHDQDFSAEPASRLIDIYESEQLTQEFRFSGTGMDDRLHWTVGAYYFQEKSDNPNPIIFPAFSFVSGTVVDNKSTAGFGQFTFDVTDKFSFTLGGRYTDEQLDSIVNNRIQFVTEFFNGTCVDACAAFSSTGEDRHARRSSGAGSAAFLGGADGWLSFPAQPDPGAFPIQPNRVFEADNTDFEPFVNLSYKWDDSWLTYFTYSEGFKGGGFTQRIPPGRTVQSFDPEKAKAFELGAKYESEDGRYRVTGAVFYTDYEDMQVDVSTALGGGLENASNAEIRGFELEAIGAVTENLVLSAGVGFLDAEYVDLEPQVTFDKDNELPNVPEWQFNASAAYTFRLGDGEAVARLDYSYSDEYFTSAQNTFLTPSYELFNGSIIYRPSSGNWELALQARNLLDEEYINDIHGNLAEGGVQIMYVGPPREVSLRFKYNFGGK